MISEQQQQQNQMTEDMYGNEVKRRRINQVGDHLKVWQVSEVLYLFPEEWKHGEVKFMHVVQEEQVPEEQVPEEQVPEEEPQEEPQEEQVPEAPMHLIGRLMNVQTNEGRFHGTLMTLFELNGERAIHIETTDGQNRIFRTSEIIGLEVLYPVAGSQNEVPQNEVPQNEVPQNEEVCLSPIPHNNEDTSDDDAETIILEDNEDNEDEDDFPDVQFIRHEPRHQSQQQQQQQQQQQHQQQQPEEPNCCAICFDATDNARNFVSLDCGHQFHFACIIGNMASGGPNRNQCPMCRGNVISSDVDRSELDYSIGTVHERAHHLQYELDRTQAYREALGAEYARIMQMNIAIGTRHEDEQQARDALDRRAYIHGLNERIATVVARIMTIVSSDIQQNNTSGMRANQMHFERQVLDVCMGFGMMAYDRQYDEQPQAQDQYQDQDQYQAQEDMMMEEETPRIVARREPGFVYINEVHSTPETQRATEAVISAAQAAGESVILITANGDMVFVA